MSDFDIETHDFDLEEPTDSAQVVEIEQRGAKNIDKTEPADSYHRYYLYSKSDQKAKCRVCGVTVSRKNYGTTAMALHLK
jgi:ribosomal protein S27E